MTNPTAKSIPVDERPACAGLLSILKSQDLNGYLTVVDGSCDDLTDHEVNQLLQNAINTIFDMNRKPTPMKKMTQIKRSKLIKYRWRTDVVLVQRDGRRNALGIIKPEHVTALEESAEERIAEMMAQGYTCGELNDNIRMTDDDPENGVEYTGWWEVSTSEK
jgi:hypothetical protein